MIIVRSPLRVTIGGGGTDQPSYYAKFGGFCVSAAIDKYVYVSVSRPFADEIILHYSRTEHVKTVDEIEHPIIREAMRLTETEGPIEITSFADVPGGTGLGSSGSFTTALVMALYEYNCFVGQKREIAEMACEIEIERLHEPIGKQDQYIAAVGGIRCFVYGPHVDDVGIFSLDIPKTTEKALVDNLLLFFTGYSRKAANLLKDQVDRSRDGDPDMIANLHHVKESGLESKRLLQAGDMLGYARLLSDDWETKKKRSPGMSNPQIDKWYELGMNNGAWGGVLTGAGGGGFLKFYAADPEKLRDAMEKAGLREVRFGFDYEGTKVIES
jgi:D-glycero-alpha-D-manno-heptose-7-phosphate kinase